jgi:hypothetical protein
LTTYYQFSDNKEFNERIKELFEGLEEVIEEEIK